MKWTKLPIGKSINVHEARATDLVNIVVKDKTTGSAVDLSTYALSGEIKATKGRTATKLADVAFANDLANGVIRGYVAEADANDLVDTYCEDATVYADIKLTEPGGLDRQLYEFALTLKKVATS